VTIPEETGLRWLIQRRIDYGKPPDAARAWVLGSDQRNARVVESTRGRADAVIRIGD
jgi:hypothetical protein